MGLYRSVLVAHCPNHLILDIYPLLRNILEGKRDSDKD